MTAGMICPSRDCKRYVLHTPYDVGRWSLVVGRWSWYVSKLVLCSYSYYYYYVRMGGGALHPAPGLMYLAFLTAGSASRS